MISNIIRQYDQNKPVEDNNYIITNIYKKAKNLSKNLILRSCKKIDSRAIFYSIW